MVKPTIKRKVRRNLGENIVLHPRKSLRLTSKPAPVYFDDSGDDTPFPQTSSAKIRNQTLIYLTKANKKVWIKGHNFDTAEPTTVGEVNTPRKFSALAYHKGSEMIYQVGGTVVKPVTWERDSWLNLGKEISNPCNIVTRYACPTEFQNSKPLKCKNLCNPRKEFGLAVCGNYLYATGGCFDSPNNMMNTVERLELGPKVKDAKWTVLKSTAMMYTRCAHSVAVLGDKLYAIGGIGVDTDNAQAQGILDISKIDSVDLNSAEVFDTSTPSQDWQPVAKMNVPRAYAMCAVMQGKIYLLGGSKEKKDVHGRRRKLSTVECYDPNQNCWTMLPCMRTRRSRGVVVVQDPLLFVLGGDSDDLPTMEVYDSRENTWTLQEWPEGLSKEADFTSAIVISPR